MNVLQSPKDTKYLKNEKILSFDFRKYYFNRVWYSNQYFYVFDGFDF